MKKLLSGLAAFFSLLLVVAQTPVSGVINSYKQVLALSSNACNSTVTLTNTSGLNRGDLVFIIQMQGAIIDTADAVSYGDVISYNHCGNYEFARIKSLTPTTVEFTDVLAKPYTVSGKVQLVKVPEYQTANIVSNVTPLNWNGTIGGVVVMVADTILLNANICADSAGFGGGVTHTASTYIYGSMSYYYPINSDRGAPKGDGVAIKTNSRFEGRGANANGGGGGNDHNAGGGGGGNISNGGIGGCQNGNPSVCVMNGGIGGKLLDFASGYRIFLGGGGGAGHGNTTSGSETPGGVGGGIVVIKANFLISSSLYAISANGQSVVRSAYDDGCGGGGAAGSILLDIGSVAGNVQLNCDGGNGGSTTYVSAGCVGPGGGGSGGALLLNNIHTTYIINKNGGINGTHVSNPTCGIRNAEAGDTGKILLTTVNIPQFEELNLGPDTSLSCYDSLYIILDAASPGPYLWNDGSTDSFKVITSPGTYYVQRGSGICTLSDTISISQVAGDTTFIHDTTLCNLGSILLCSSVLGADSYLWNTGETSQCKIFPGAAHASVVAQKGLCMTKDSFQINFVNIPPINIGNDTFLCGLDSFTLIETTYSSHLWSNGSHANAITTYTSGNYWVIADSLGCTVIDSIELIFISQPNVVLRNDTTLCNVSTFLLNAGSLGPYLWSNGSTASSIIINSSGLYWVRIGTDSCNFSDSVNIQLINIPDVEILGDTIACNLDSLTLIASAYSNLHWSTGQTSTSISVSNINLVYLTADSLGCQVSDSVNLYYYSNDSLNLPDSVLICDGEDVVLDAGENGPYLWNDLSTNQYLAVNSSGIYWVKIGANGCYFSDTTSVSFNANPLVNLPNDTSICAGDSIWLFAGVADQYLWNTGDTTQSIWVVDEGTYYVALSNGNCIGTDTFYLTLNEKPPVFLQDSFTICYEDAPLVLDAGPIGPYYWNTGETDRRILAELPGLFYVVTGSECQAFDSTWVKFDTCTEIMCKLLVPTAFSPNNDGVNDEFQIFATCPLTKYDLKVFNRWGQWVFESNDISHSWNGIFNFRLQDLGVFSWVLVYRFDDSTEDLIQKGNVTLIK